MLNYYCHPGLVNHNAADAQLLGLLQRLLFAIKGYQGGEDGREGAATCPHGSPWGLLKRTLSGRCSGTVHILKVCDEDSLEEPALG